MSFVYLLFIIFFVGIMVSAIMVVHKAQTSAERLIRNFMYQWAGIGTIILVIIIMEHSGDKNILKYFSLLSAHPAESCFVMTILFLITSIIQVAIVDKD